MKLSQPIRAPSAYAELRQAALFWLAERDAVRKSEAAQRLRGCGRHGTAQLAIPQL